MTRRTAAAATTLLCLLLLPGLAAAQNQQTPNTLTLSASAPTPKATLADVALLVGHWKGGFLGSTAEGIWLPPAGESGVARKAASRRSTNSCGNCDTTRECMPREGKRNPPLTRDPVKCEICCGNLGVHHGKGQKSEDRQNSKTTYVL